MHHKSPITFMAHREPEAAGSNQRCPHKEPAPSRLLPSCLHNTRLRHGGQAPGFPRQITLRTVAPTWRSNNPSGTRSGTGWIPLALHPKAHMLEEHLLYIARVIRFHYIPPDVRALDNRRKRLSLGETRMAQSWPTTACFGTGRGDRQRVLCGGSYIAQLGSYSTALPRCRLADPTYDTPSQTVTGPQAPPRRDNLDRLSSVKAQV